jgi:hyperosmotically inducible periplasmic protein
MHCRFSSFMLVNILLWGSAAFAQDTGPPKSTAPDNTKVNKRDRSPAAPTADQAKETTADRDIMSNIRKAIVADKSLSTYAHNVKIISQHGKVTLKGPVRSDEERKSVETKAVDVAGSGNVTNQLSVKPETSSK